MSPYFNICLCWGALWGAEPMCKKISKDRLQISNTHTMYWNVTWLMIERKTFTRPAEKSEGRGEAMDWLTRLVLVVGGGGRSGKYQISGFRLCLLRHKYSGELFHFRQIAFVGKRLNTSSSVTKWEVPSFLSDPSPISWLPLSQTHLLTHWLLFSRLHWCDSGLWRCQPKTSWCC